LQGYNRRLALRAEGLVAHTERSVKVQQLKSSLAEQTTIYDELEGKEDWFDRSAHK
jgi:hypothetical protein